MFLQNLRLEGSLSSYFVQTPPKILFFRRTKTELDRLILLPGMEFNFSFFPYSDLESDPVITTFSFRDKIK